MLFAAGGLFFVIQRISATWDETGPVVRSAEPAWIAFAVVLAGAGMTAIAVPWVRALGMLGGRLGRGRAVLLYYVGEIGKYLPGGIWPVVGRGELAHRAGIGRSVAYSSVLLSLATLYLCSLVVAGGLLPIVIADGASSAAPMLLILLVPIGLVVLHPAVMARVLQLGSRLTRRSFEFEPPGWSSMLALVASYVPAWLLIGTSTWAVSKALATDPDWVELCLATVLSWAAGFLVAPAPGGVGVREAVFVAMAPSIPSGIAAAVALCARLIFMLVDAAGAGVSALLLGTRAKEYRKGARVSAESSP